MKVNARGLSTECVLKVIFQGVGERATEGEGAGALPIARATPALNGFLYPCLLFCDIIKIPYF